MNSIRFCLISTKDNYNPQQNFSKTILAYIRQASSELIIRATSGLLLDTTTYTLDNWIKSTASYFSSQMFGITEK